MAAKKTPKTTKGAIQIVPERGWVKKKKSELPRRFPPHRLKGIDPDSINERTIGQLRQLTDKQLDRLLKALGLTRTTPNAWERAFRLIGHPRRNKVDKLRVIGEYRMHGLDDSIGSLLALC